MRGEDWEWGDYGLDKVPLTLYPNFDKLLHGPVHGLWRHRLGHAGHRGLVVCWLMRAGQTQTKSCVHGRWWRRGHTTARRASSCTSSCSAPVCTSLCLALLCSAAQPSGWKTSLCEQTVQLMCSDDQGCGRHAACRPALGSLGTVSEQPPPDVRAEVQAAMVALPNHAGEAKLAVEVFLDFLVCNLRCPYVLQARRSWR